MKGTIKAYSDVVSAGVISGEDGTTYGFNLTDWHGRKLPISRERVIFVGNHKQATSVSADKESAT